MKPEEFAAKYLPLFQEVDAPDPSRKYNAKVNVGSPAPSTDSYLLVPNVWNTYADGYRAVADWMVETLPDSQIPCDIAVYPIAFCYRHYLELRLKALIVTGQELFDQQLAQPNHHDLKALWEAVVPTLYEIWPNELAHQDYQCISLIIGELSEVDVGSMAFRYPVDRQGERFLADLKYVNIRRLEDAMTEIAPTLDAIATEIEMYLDYKLVVSRQQPSESE